jgi:hypothetical protein
VNELPEHDFVTAQWVRQWPSEEAWKRASET